jgi:hypothetical protein
LALSGVDSPSMSGAGQPLGSGTAATREEIIAAIEALTAAQLVRLENLAWFRHHSLGSRRAGRQPRDLLSDSVIACLEGRRRWIKSNCDFPTFLAGVLRSLASHIRDGRAVDAFDDLAVNPANDDKGGQGYVEQIVDRVSVDPESQLIARQICDGIRDHFKDDPPVLLVLTGLLEKMKPSDIRSAAGMSEREFNAAAKRLRRYVRQTYRGNL